MIGTLADEIKALREGIVVLDKSVAEAPKGRKLRLQECVRL